MYYDHLYSFSLILSLRASPQTLPYNFFPPLLWEMLISLGVSSSFSSLMSYAKSNDHADIKGLNLVYDITITYLRICATYMCPRPNLGGPLYILAITD